MTSDVAHTWTSTRPWLMKMATRRGYGRSLPSRSKQRTHGRRSADNMLGITTRQRNGWVDSRSGPEPVINFLGLPGSSQAVGDGAAWGASGLIGHRPLEACCSHFEPRSRLAGHTPVSCQCPGVSRPLTSPPAASRDRDCRGNREARRHASQRRLARLRTPLPTICPSRSPIAGPCPRAAS